MFFFVVVVFVFVVLVVLVVIHQNEAFGVSAVALNFVSKASGSGKQESDQGNEEKQGFDFVQHD